MVSAQKEEEVQGQRERRPDTLKGKEEGRMVSEQDMPVGQYDIDRRFISSGGRCLPVFLQEDSTCRWTITAVVSFAKRRDGLAVANELPISGNSCIKDVRDRESQRHNGHGLGVRSLRR